MPTPYIPVVSSFPGIPNFFANLDFSGFPRYEDIKDISGPQDIRPTLFDFDVDEILKNIDTEKFEDIDFSNFQNVDYTTDFADFSRDTASPGLSLFDTPSVAPTMPTTPAIMPKVPVQEPMNFTASPPLPQSFFENIPKPQPLPMPQVPVMPEPIVPAPRPAPVPQAPIQVPSLPSLPMNFTGLPQIPVMPEPIAPLPVIPQIPVMPQITYTPPVPSFVQPRIEDIVSPIRTGSLRNFQQPGLFSLV